MICPFFQNLYFHFSCCYKLAAINVKRIAFLVKSVNLSISSWVGDMDIFSYKILLNSLHTLVKASPGSSLV